MGFKSQVTKEIEQKRKNQTENNNMQKIKNAKTFWTVVITLVSVAAIAGLVYTGFTFGRSYERGINQDVTAQAKALSATMSKTNQQ